MRRVIVFSAVAALLLGSAISHACPGTIFSHKGRVVIPDSSIERPEDVGYRMHTNTRVFVPANRAKWGAEPSGLALPDVAGLTPAGPPFTGYAFETPASLACLYGLVTAVAGCNPEHFQNQSHRWHQGHRDRRCLRLSDRDGGSERLFDTVRFTQGDRDDLQVVFAGGTGGCAGTDPGNNPGWEGEQALDIDMAHAMSPNAKIFLVEAASNSLTDLLVAEDCATKLVAAAGGKGNPAGCGCSTLSVLVTDAFMKAVEDNAPWELFFGGPDGAKTTWKVLSARELWDKINAGDLRLRRARLPRSTASTVATIFWYCENIAATNPRGEHSLPPYGACLLGSINLASLVEDPFTAEARLDLDRLRRLVPDCVRMMDNVIDISLFPLPQQKEEASQKRRIGLGVTGLADALIMCGLRYGSTAAVAATESWLATIQRDAYLASTALAEEKGPFPLFDRDRYLAGETVAGLDEAVRAKIAQSGIRNALITSVAIARHGR